MTVVHYIRTDSTAGGDGTEDRTDGTTRAFASMSEAEGHIGGASLAEVWEFRCSTGAGTAADTTAVTITDFSTSAANYLLFTSIGAARHAGSYDANKYRLAIAGGVCIENYEDYVRFDGIQFAPTGNATCIYNGTETASLLKLDSCIFKGTGATSSGTRYGLRNIEGAVGIYNCLFYDIKDSTDGYAVNQTTGTVTISAYNCTVHNCRVGFQETTGTVNCYNCGAASCTTGFSAGVTQTTCSTDTPTFVDESGDNFHLNAADSTWQGQGTNYYGTFTTDIDGNTRPDTGAWDIGADEITSSTTPLTPSMGDDMDSY